MGILNYEIYLHTDHTPPIGAHAGGRYSVDAAARRVETLMSIRPDVTHATLAKNTDSLPFLRIERDGTRTEIKPDGSYALSTEDLYDTIRDLAGRLFVHRPDTLTLSRLGVWDGAWAYERVKVADAYRRVAPLGGDPSEPGATAGAEICRLVDLMRQYAAREDADRDTFTRTARYPLAIEIYIL